MRLLDYRNSEAMGIVLTLLWSLIALITAGWTIKKWRAWRKLGKCAKCFKNIRQSKQIHCYLVCQQKWTQWKLKAYPDTTNLRSKATFCSEVQTSNKQFNWEEIRKIAKFSSALFQFFQTIFQWRPINKHCNLFMYLCTNRNTAKVGGVSSITIIL